MDQADVATPAPLRALLHPDGLHLHLGSPTTEDLLVALARDGEEGWEDVDVLPAGSAEEVLAIDANPGDRVLLRGEDGTPAAGPVLVLDPAVAPEPAAAEEPPAAAEPQEAPPAEVPHEEAPDEQSEEVREALWQLASTMEERHPEWNAHAEGPVLHVHGRFGNTFRVAAEALSAGNGEVRAVCAISARGDFTLLAASGRDLLRAEERAGTVLQWHLYALPAHIDAAALAQNPEAARRYRHPASGRPGTLPEGALPLLREVGVDVAAPLDRCSA